MMKFTETLIPGLLLCFCFAACLSGNDQSEIIKQKKALESYNKQKYRFELRDCHFYYNGKLLLFHDSLYKYEKIFGHNYINYQGNLFFRDAPIYMDTQWANQEARFRHKPGADKDSTRIVNNIQILLSYPDDLDITWGATVEINKFIRQQKPLGGFVMIDSVLVNAESDINDVNEQLLKRTGYAKIQSFHGSPNSLGYVYYYPEANSCTPIADKSLPTTTTISLWREKSKKIGWLAYGYTENDRAPDATAEKRLQEVDSAIRINTDHRFKTKTK